MKKREQFVILVVLFGSLVGLTVLTLTSRSQEGSVLESFPRRTSYSTRPNGAKALFVTLEELGVPVSRHRQSFEHLPESGELLLVLSPWQPISRKEWRALKTWVAKGRTACIGLEDELVPDWMARTVDGNEDDTLKVQSATPSADVALARRVSEIRLKGPTRLVAKAAGPDLCPVPARGKSLTGRSARRATEEEDEAWRH